MSFLKSFFLTRLNLEKSAKSIWINTPISINFKRFWNTYICVVERKNCTCTYEVSGVGMHEVEKKLSCPNCETLKQKVKILRPLNGHKGLEIQTETMQGK